MKQSFHAITLQGTVESGDTACVKPLPHTIVTLFEATTAQPNRIGRAVSDASGHFMVESPTGASPSVFYLEAGLGSRVHFVTVLGSALPPYATINELTTVAASYSMPQFYRTDVIAGNPAALKISAGMNKNLVFSVTGESSPVLLASPNGDETISLRATRTRSNLLAQCAAVPANTASTGGSPVLLHNGDPLYGWFFLPSFTPMIRQTASSIDQAGNVWSINNWKPDFNIDVLLNPGGDGILIFVGLAAPPVAQRN